MSRRDGCVLVGLALLAGFIWVRDRSWTASILDTLPIILALPLFYWLSGPWPFREQSGSVSAVGVACGIALMLAGVLGGLVLLLAMGWTVLLGCWLSARLASDATARAGLPRHRLVVPSLWRLGHGRGVLAHGLRRHS